MSVISGIVPATSSGRPLRRARGRPGDAPSSRSRRIERLRLAVGRSVAGLEEQIALEASGSRPTTVP